MDDWGSQPMKVMTEDWKCRWPLLAGHRRSCRLWKANHGRLEEPTMEGAEGRLVGMTQYFLQLPSMPTYSACNRYCPVIEGADDCGEPTMDDWECQP
nr:unnamed protein product [Spirometra erinaceieuropaei]